jgi:hypothetical protein
MSKSVSAPPPPGLTKEERDLIEKQGYTLDQFSNLLSDQSIQTKSTQNLLQQVSGLYKSVDTPAGPETTSYNVNASTVSPFVGKNRGFLDDNTIRKNFDKPTSDFLINFAQGSLGKRGDGAGRGTRGTQEAFDALNQIASGQATLKDYGLTADDIKGTQFAKEIKTPGAAAHTDMVLDPDAVKDLKARIQANQNYESGLRDSTNSFIDQFVQQNLAGPGELQKKQDTIANLQADRLTSALKGELPISPALTQRKNQDFQQLKESLARSGHVITGDSPDEAQGFSTPAIQSLESFKKTYGLLEDQERRGEIDAGTQANIAQYGLLSADQQNKLGQALTLRGLTGTGDASLGYATGANGAGPASLLPQYQSLSSGYAGMAQPYQYQRGMQYQTGLQNASNAAAGNASIYQLLGTGLGSGAALLALSSRRFKKNIKKQKAKDERKMLSALTRTGTYTYDYKFEPSSLRPNHVGVIVEEAPAEIVAADGIHLDVVNYLGALHSSVRALNREVKSLRRMVA